MRWRLYFGSPEGEDERPARNLVPMKPGSGVRVGHGEPAASLLSCCDCRPFGGHGRKRCQGGYGVTGPRAFVTNI